MTLWLYLGAWILVISEDPWRKRHIYKEACFCFQDIPYLSTFFCVSKYSRQNNVDKEEIV